MQAKKPTQGKPLEDKDLVFTSMPRTQAVIIINTNGLPNKKVKVISEFLSGFKACTVVKTMDQVGIVKQHNKNALFFTGSCNFIQQIKVYFPDAIEIKLTSGSTRKGYMNNNPDNLIQSFPKATFPYGIDVGDHRSKDSVGSAAQSTKECLLCRILNHDTPHQEHILFNWNFFYAVPGTGAFAPGYIMVVPKRHVMSFANLNEAELAEFKKIHIELRKLLTRVYHMPVFSFECSSGRTGAGKNHNSIIHAHFHFICVPKEMNILQEITKSGITPALIKPEELTKYNEYPYMLYCDQQYNWYIEGDPDAYFPRQHPRQVLAQWMGIYSKYNWRIYPMREKMDQIANEIRSYCGKHLNDLPNVLRKHILFED